MGIYSSERIVKCINSMRFQCIVVVAVAVVNTSMSNLNIIHGLVKDNFIYVDCQG